MKDAIGNFIENIIKLYAPTDKDHLEFIKNTISNKGTTNETFVDGDQDTVGYKKISPDKAIKYVEDNIDNISYVDTYRDGGSSVFRFKDGARVGFWIDNCTSRFHAYASVNDFAYEQIIKGK